MYSYHSNSTIRGLTIFKLTQVLTFSVQQVSVEKAIDRAMSSSHEQTIPVLASAHFYTRVWVTFEWIQTDLY